MRPIEIIARKRDGHILAPEEIEAFVGGVARDEISDAQAAAFLMAVYLRGLSSHETGALTLAMMRSGETLDLSGLDGPKVDKHSTGGLGDKTSLVVAPVVAACGAVVPMISGRGLGHTGGTLDKLESIPGFRTDLSLCELTEQLIACGVGITGQTPELCPADRRLYAIRDVTATVASIPLIAASIMSKKLAEGIDALVLDVKTGSGAFMVTIEDARALARALCESGRAVGVTVRALITDMSQPLGRAVGNALEVREAIETLKGGGPKDFRALCRVVGTRMLLSAGIAEDEEEGLSRFDAAIADGSAFTRFVEMVRRQGGDPAAVEQAGRLPQAPVARPLTADRSGVVQAIRTTRVGEAVIELGGGRTRIGDPVDPAVGFVFNCRLGREVSAGEELAVVHAATDATAEEAALRLAAAIEIGEEAVKPPVLIHEEIA